MRNPFRYFKTSPGVIHPAVMMYVRFPLSLRQVGDLLHERGIGISHETARVRWKRYGRPEAIVTDRLCSYRAAIKGIGNEARQATGRWLNNRAENSHRPFRRGERAMVKIRSAKPLQKSASVHSSVHNHFNQQRHLYRRENFKLNLSTALAGWRQLAA